MLQKGFFNVEPFNPRPYKNYNILNLSGATKFEANTIFVPGRYSVDVQAGGLLNSPSAETGRVVQNINIFVPFIIRAYCGSGANGNIPGVNPYSGEFKVNGRNTNTPIPDINHIFGNAGSPGIGLSGSCGASSGNCLGNGVKTQAGDSASAAGSCLHFIPLEGTFGVDYLAAFHATGRATADVMSYNSGSGGAYGGGASGSAVQGYNTVDGGNTPYGNGGDGVVGPNYGIDGYGIGGGHADQSGVAAWFDGTTWRESNAINTDGQGHIIVTYLGSL